MYLNSFISAVLIQILDLFSFSVTLFLITENFILFPPETHPTDKPALPSLHCHIHLGLVPAQITTHALACCSTQATTHTLACCSTQTTTYAPAWFPSEQILNLLHDALLLLRNGLLLRLALLYRLCLHGELYKSDICVLVRCERYCLVV